jgi:hypothetical protein
MDGVEDRDDPILLRVARRYEAVFILVAAIALIVHASGGGFAGPEEARPAGPNAAQVAP